MCMGVCVCVCVGGERDSSMTSRLHADLAESSTSEIFYRLTAGPSLYSERPLTVIMSI